MQSSKPQIAQELTGIAHHVLGTFLRSGGYHLPGAKGDARETVIANLLNQFLPLSLRAQTKVQLYHKGVAGGPCEHDIVLYNPENAVVWPFDAEKTLLRIPARHALLGMEVKSTLTKKEYVKAVSHARRFRVDVRRATGEEQAPYVLVFYRVARSMWKQLMAEMEQGVCPFDAVVSLEHGAWFSREFRTPARMHSGGLLSSQVHLHSEIANQSACELVAQISAPDSFEEASSARPGSPNESRFNEQLVADALSALIGFTLYCWGGDAALDDWVGLCKADGFVTVAGEPRPGGFDMHARAAELWRKQGVPGFEESLCQFFGLTFSWAQAPDEDEPGWCLGFANDSTHDAFQDIVCPTAVTTAECYKALADREDLLTLLSDVMDGRENRYSNALARCTARAQAVLQKQWEQSASNGGDLFPTLQAA